MQDSSQGGTKLAKKELDIVILMAARFHNPYDLNPHNTEIGQWQKAVDKNSCWIW